MDQELIAYFDAQFKQVTNLQEETRGEVASFREETRREIASLGEETRREIASLREEANRRFEQLDSRLQRMEDTDRQTFVVIEGLRHEMQLVAEGVLGLDDKLQRYHTESVFSFNQVRGWIEPYYKELNGRVTVMESWADRHLGDVMDAIRKLVGRPLPQPNPSE